jgi:ATP-dependent RNA helicase DDX41
MIGIAFTGSGKTLAFCLPLIMLALEAETRLPVIRGEGPVGIILCPSRELATQTHENVLAWTDALARGGYARLNTLLCIGGISMGDQAGVLARGLHIVVATPGRLQDMLEKRRFVLDDCRYLCMDEADRMIDLGFEEDVRNIMSFFKVSVFCSCRDEELTRCYSASARRSSSPRRCRARFRTLRRHR